MKVRTEFPRTVRMLEDEGIVMPDGTRLSARIWLPEDAGDDPVPAILEHLPYRKRDGTTARDMVSHPWMAGHGYAVIRTDMRGTGDSEGRLEDEYLQVELDDACAVIAWARAQPWCTGKVGMMGISWGGFNCLQVAAMRPEGLEAVASMCSTTDRFADDIHYKGGAMLGENLGWAAQMLAYSARPPDPLITGNRWRQVWEERLAAQPFLLAPWIEHQRRDAYWRHGSVCEDWSAITAAVLAVGGWHDGYRNTPAALVENLAAPCKAIIGPWIHKYPHMAGPAPAIGFLQEMKRWWDRWLKGLDTGVEADPDMRLWLMDAVRPAAWLDERPGRWIAVGDWPDAVPETWHLSDRGLGAEGPLDRQVTSPADCGAGTGEYFPFAFGPELPLDQRGDDALSACWDSAPLTQDRDIVGAPRVALRLSADRPQGQIAVRLCDVFPDGTSALISHGMLNLSHRNGSAAPEPMVPGEIVDLVVTLDQIAYRLPAGHRLRVAVSTAYWPFLWPSPAPVTLHVTAGRLDLPVRARAEGDELTFEEPEGAAPWNIEVHSPGRCTRRREIDLETGASVLVVTQSDGDFTDRDHGLRQSAHVEERWAIHPDDPLCASGRIRWEKRMSRGDWSVRVVTTSELTADATHFHLKAGLTAWEGETLVTERSWDERIARDNL